jgi:hypothetical protein
MLRRPRVASTLQHQVLRPALSMSCYLFIRISSHRCLLRLVLVYELLYDAGVYVAMEFV